MILQVLDGACLTDLTAPASQQKLIISKHRHYHQHIYWNPSQCHIVILTLSNTIELPFSPLCLTLNLIKSVENLWYIWLKWCVLQRAALTAFEQIPTSCHRVIGSPDTWLAPTLGPRALPPSIQMSAPLYLVKHLREPVSAKTDEFFQQFWRTNLCCRFSCIALKNTNNSDSKP